VPFILDRPALAAELSLPFDGDRFESRYLTSYRVRQGVLHNPGKGSPHHRGRVPYRRRRSADPLGQEGGARATFAALMRAALNAPDDLLRLPYRQPAGGSAPLGVAAAAAAVSPAVPGGPREVDGNPVFRARGLVANLDFVDASSAMPAPLSAGERTPASTWQAGAGHTAA